MPRGGLPAEGWIDHHGCLAGHTVKRGGGIEVVGFLERHGVRSGIAAHAHIGRGGGGGVEVAGVDARQCGRPDGAEEDVVGAKGTRHQKIGIGIAVEIADGNDLRQAFVGACAFQGKGIGQRIGGRGRYGGVETGIGQGHAGKVGGSGQRRAKRHTDDGAQRGGRCCGGIGVFRRAALDGLVGGGIGPLEIGVLALNAVVAVAAQQLVVAGAAGDEIGFVAAIDDIVSGTPKERVHTVAATDIEVCVGGGPGGDVSSAYAPCFAEDGGKRVGMENVGSAA